MFSLPDSDNFNFLNEKISELLGVEVEYLFGRRRDDFILTEIKYVMFFFDQLFIWY